MTRVYYFTRTGDSRTIASSIAAQTGGTLCPIRDGRSWGGVFGYIRAGYSAVRKKTVPAAYDKPGADDEIYLCFPIWAGSFPPAVRAFVGEVGRERITAVPTSMSSHLAEAEGFKRLVEVIGKDKTVKV